MGNRIATTLPDGRIINKNCIMVPDICTRLTWMVRLSTTLSVTTCTGKPYAAKAECTPVLNMTAPAV